MRTYYDTFSTNIPLDSYPIHFCRSSTTFISDGYIIVPYTQCNHLTVFTSASLILVILGLFPFSSLFFYHLIMVNRLYAMHYTLPALLVFLPERFFSFSHALIHAHTIFLHVYKKFTKWWFGICYIVNFCDGLAWRSSPCMAMSGFTKRVTSDWEYEKCTLSFVMSIMGGSALLNQFSWMIHHKSLGANNGRNITTTNNAIH